MATAKAALTEDQMQLIAKALADPRRYDILKRIASSGALPTACSAMRDCCEVAPATLSHHMKELETAGLIRSEKDGKFVNYFAQPKVLRVYFAQLKSDLL